MKRLILCLLLLGIAGCGPKGQSGRREQGGESEQEAIAALEKLHARIQRDADGKVVEVYFYYADITNDDLRHLKGLTSLESLTLVDVYLIFDRSLPWELELRGRITDAGLEHVKKLTSLTTLALRLTKITDAGLVHLMEMKSLTTLDLNGTQITAASLEQLKGLELDTLTIPSRAKTDVGLKNYLAARRPVTALNFRGWKITDAGLVNLQELTSLKEVFLYKTQITDVGLEQLKGLTNLKVLNLYGTQITDEGLEHLKGLTSLAKLGLGDTQISDAGLVHLKTITSLQNLYLFGTQVTDAGVVELQKALPNRRISRLPEF